jgi:hypothetical protein
MDMTPSVSPPPPASETGGLTKNTIIIVLVTLLLLSILGINIFLLLGQGMNYAGQGVNSVASILSPVVNQLLSTVGYASGTILEKTDDALVTTAKTGIDIGSGAIKNVANLLKGGAQGTTLSDAVNTSRTRYNEPTADSSINPIQKPITANKTNWCLVGEHQGRRGCIEVGQEEKCLSGQIFPTRQACLNPMYLQDVSPLKSVFTRS